VLKTTAGTLGERAEDQVDFLRTAVPAAEQQAPVADLAVVSCNPEALSTWLMTFSPNAPHRHHVVVEIGNDPNGASDDEEDDQQPERQS